MSNIIRRSGRSIWPVLAAILVVSYALFIPPTPLAAQQAPAPTPASTPSGTPSAIPPTPVPTPSVRPGAQQTAAPAQPPVRVIIELRPGVLPAGAAGAATPVTPAQTRDAFISSPGVALSSTKKLQSLPVVVAEVSPGDLAALRANPQVARVFEDEPVYANDVQGGALIKQPYAHGLGFTGSGVTVAVVDSGVDITHPSFSDDLVGGACFLAPNGCPGGVATGIGLTSAADSASGTGHGTAVTGIITGNGSAGVPTGVAPAAKVFPYRVLGTTGAGLTSDVILALDDINANHPEIGIVNLSLGGGTPSFSACDASTSYTTVINALTARGTLVVVSSGNDASFTGVTRPACVTNSISVGAVYDANIGAASFSSPSCTDTTTAADKIACYSNSTTGTDLNGQPLLDVLAPSHCALTAALSGGTDTCFGGTSAAAPYTAGALAVLRSAGQSAVVAAARIKVGTSITDARNGVSRPRIDLQQALGATQLAFQTSPGGAVTGSIDVLPQAVFATQPVIELRDAGGNVVTSATNAVTLAIKSGTGTSGATLLGTTTVNAVSGVATFTDIQIDRPGTGYVLTATATGLTSADSASFNVTQGAATQLAIVTSPAGATGGVAFTTQPVVRILDGNGNLVTAATNNVTLAIKSGTGTPGAALSGTATVAAVGGVATFSGLKINLAGTGYVLTATASGLTSVDTSAFNVTVGPAALLAVSTSPAGATGGVAFTTQPVVEVRDAGGNLVTSATNNVTLAIKASTGTSGATLSGTTTVAAVSGVATFSGLKIDLAGTGYVLSATATGLTAGDTSAFNVTVGPATQLAYRTAPAGAVTGSIEVTPQAIFTTQPAVEVRDAGGNLVTSATNAVTLAIKSGTGTSGATLSGTTTLNASSGLASFTDIRIDRPGTGYVLTATAAGLTSADSASFNVTQGAAATLSVQTSPAGATGGVAFTTQPVVRLLDGDGNLVTAATNNVTLAIKASTGTSGAVLSGTTTVAAISGVATFSGLKIDLAGTGYVLTATATGVTAADTSAFNVTVGPATQLAYRTAPAGAVTGSIEVTPQAIFTTQPVVEVRDAGGNLVTSATNAVTLAIKASTGASGATLSGTTTVSAASGVATFTDIQINRPGTGYVLTASATELTSADSAPFNVTQGAAASLSVQTSPAGATGGVAFTTQPVVRLLDGDGNLVTAATNNVTLAIKASTGTSGATLSGTTTVAAVGGVATFSGLKIDLAGTGYVLTATATGVTAAADTGAFNVPVGPAALLAAATSPAGATGGVAFTTQPVIEVRDAGDNLVTSATNNVTLAIKASTGASGAALSGTTTVAAISGVATFSGLKIDLVGTGYVLSATATGLTAGDTSAFNVTVGPATQLAYRTAPAGAVTGSIEVTPQAIFTTQPVVEVRDAGGNLVTSATNAVTLAIKASTGTSGASLLGTITVNAVAGVATFTNVRIDRPGTGYVLTASAAGLTPADSASFAVTQGAVTSLRVQTPPAGAASGAVFTTQPVVEAVDGDGNVVTGFAGTVAVVIKGGTGGFGAALLGTASVSAVAGVATFSDLRIDLAATGYVLTFATAGVPAADSASFNVAVGDPVGLAFRRHPSGGIAGAALTGQPIVRVVDAAGNTVPSTATITLAIKSGTGATGAILSGTSALAATGGVATFTDLSIDLNAAGYVLRATSPGLTSVDSSAFAVRAGAVALTTPASGAAGGAPFGAQPVFTLRNAGGVVAVTEPVVVSIKPGTGSPGAVLSGTTTVNTVTGVATFTNLRIDKAGSGYVLIASVGGTSPSGVTAAAAATDYAGIESAPFDVGFGAAVDLAFQTQPVGGTPGSALTTQPVVVVRDAGLNTVPTAVNAITVAIKSGSGSPGAVLAGTATVTAVNGIATFSGLSIGTAGTSYVLTASAAGLTAADSSAFNVTTPTPPPSGGGGGGGGGGAVAPTPTPTPTPATVTVPEKGGVSVVVRTPVTAPVQAGAVTVAEASTSSGSGKVTAQTGAFPAGTVLTIAMADSAAGLQGVAPTQERFTILAGFQVKAERESGGAITDGFVQPVHVEFTLQPAALPANVVKEDLGVFYWDGTAWVEIPNATVRFASDGTVVVDVQVTHFTLFSVMHRPSVLATKPGFRSAIAPLGVSLALWNGGSIADAVATPGVQVKSVWVYRDGVPVGYIAGAPDFVNQAFVVLFPGGAIPEGTFMAVVTG